jgi:hypothetical protein
MIDHFGWFQMPHMYICKCSPCYECIVVHSVIVGIVGWTKPDPIYKGGSTMGIPTHCHLVTLDKYSPRFSEGEILHKEGISMTLGGLRQRVER